MGSWAQWTAKTALLAAGFAAAAGSGLSGVALAAGGSAGSDAGPGLGLGLLVAPAGACDDAGCPARRGRRRLPGRHGRPFPGRPGPSGPGYREYAAGRERSVPGQSLRQHGRRARRLHRGLRERRAGRRHAATARFRNRVRRRRRGRDPAGRGPGHVGAGRGRARAPRAHRGTREEHLR